MTVRNVLPLSCAPRGLNRVAAAAYLSLSASKFDELVAKGLMPQPKCVGTRKIWCRLALDAAFEALPTAGEDDDNPWNAVA